MIYSAYKLWKILKEMGVPDHLTCLLSNLYAGQEATVTTGHGTTDRFQIGKGVHQGCILSPWIFNLYAKYIMRNTELEEAQAGIKIAGRNNITSDMQMTPTLRKRSRKQRSWHPVPSLHWKYWGNSRNSVRLYFFGAPESLQMVTAAMKLKDAYSLEEKL